MSEKRPLAVAPPLSRLMNGTIIPYLEFIQPTFDEKQISTSNPSNLGVPPEARTGCAANPQPTGATICLGGTSGFSPLFLPPNLPHSSDRKAAFRRFAIPTELTKPSVQKCCDIMLATARVPSLTSRAKSRQDPRKEYEPTTNHKLQEHNRGGLSLLTYTGSISLRDLRNAYVAPAPGRP